MINQMVDDAAEPCDLMEKMTPARWKDWEFKIMARAGKKGHKEAFVTDCKLSVDKDNCTEAEQEHEKLMTAAWSQLAFVVKGHALKNVMPVKSKDPREAWIKLATDLSQAKCST
jgi:hypothetical protein